MQELEQILRKRSIPAPMMDRANVNENSKKTILGHAKKDVTNSVYVEKDRQDLPDAINMI